ncbi:hypothetical protein L3X38_018679 [Prunus dulcis]|uniref:C2H2-type domain-containing protein n=1 Tax=Prunus dulcis TaxID=3755 RepID=A0AAD4WC64_PRUDU|nr:hypothetical protein L3X38_018679 [Prunus dulcis]
MIKRRFYKLEHGDRDGPSNSSSSSSDSEIEPEAIEDSDDDDDVVEELEEDAQACSTSSGYQSEDSSANEVPDDSSDLPINEDDAKTGNERQVPLANQLFGKSGSEILEEQSNIVANEESLPVDFPDCVVKCKSAFKCRICPRVVCLNEETLRAHLKSKRHARSEKLLDEGRLKTMLNTDGKIEEEETPALYARILANSQGMPRKKSKREEKKVSRKKRMRYGAKKSKENPAKRSRK